MPTHLLGFQNQSALPAVYRAADVLVLPSDATETWGLVANEALACRTPVVVSQACGCAPDLARAGAGASFPAGDVSALARALAGVLSRPRDLAAMQNLNAAYSPRATSEGIMEAARHVCRRVFDPVIPS